MGKSGCILQWPSLTTAQSSEYCPLPWAPLVPWLLVVSNNPLLRTKNTIKTNLTQSWFPSLHVTPRTLLHSNSMTVQHCSPQRGGKGGHSSCLSHL